jgi:hypothetical protein
MTIRSSTLLTAGLLAGLILAGTFIPAHAGDGCGKDKVNKPTQTTSHWCPTTTAAHSITARSVMT